MRKARGNHPYYVILLRLHLVFNLVYRTTPEIALQNPWHVNTLPVLKGITTNLHSILPFELPQKHEVKALL
jgi:hypothetical protein